MSPIEARRTFRHGAPAPQTAQDLADRAVHKPLYSQVRDMLASQISAGQFSRGSTLPNESALAQRFRVSIGTIRRAVEGLEDMGIVLRRQGRGTFVGGHGLPTIADRLRSPRGEPLKCTRRALGASRRTSSPQEVAELLLDGLEDVLEVGQAVLVDSACIGVERSILPAGLSPRLEAGLAQGRDLYTLLADDGTILTRAEDAICAVLADDLDSQSLALPKGQPVLQVVRRAYAITGRLVELRTARYRPSSVSFLATAA